MTFNPDMDAVGQILREAAATLIVPRFRMLADHEIEEKSPGEVVTISDREAEAMITDRLRALQPGVPVVGEEAVAADSSLMEAITTEPTVWLVDPLDGTANFATGDPHWAVMVALVQDGETVMSWIYRHADDHLYLAERGSGAWRDGVRISCMESSPEVGSMRGAVLAKFLTDDERTRMIPRFCDFAEITGGFICAGYEYPAIIAGEEAFAVFQRQLPWDHAPGALLLTEAGGVVRRPDGVDFHPDRIARGLIVAANEHTWQQVRNTFYGD